MHRLTWTRAAAVTAAGLLTLTACGTGAGTASGTKSASNGGGTTVVSTGHTKLGKVLVGSGGMTVYVFVPDTSHKSNCNTGCINTWPPVGKASAGSGATASMLGTIHRNDGAVQATYHGHPLYYYSGDGKAGDVNGQGLEQFYAVSPSGQLVRGNGSSSPAPYSKSNGGGGY